MLTLNSLQAFDFMRVSCIILPPPPFMDAYAKIFPSKPDLSWFCYVWLCVWLFQDSIFRRLSRSPNQHIQYFCEFNFFKSRIAFFKQWS